MVAAGCKRPDAVKLVCDPRQTDRSGRTRGFTRGEHNPFQSGRARVDLGNVAEPVRCQMRPTAKLTAAG